MKTKFLLLILFLGSNFSFAGNSEIKEQAKQWARSKPVKFIANKGQMADMDGNPLPSVLFKAEAPHINTFITEQGLTYVFFEGEKENGKEEGGDFGKETETKWTRIDMLLKGASIKKENIIKEEASEDFSQYYFPHCPNGIRDVRSYEKITITEIYPGIDWKIYNSKETGFKYDFVVHAGADPDQIEMIYSSLNKLNLDEEGSILIKTKIGTLTENAPVSFLDGKEIKTEFKKALNEKNNNDGYDTHIQFNLPSFKTPSTSDLIIDPQLVWATYFGGAILDGALDVACDPTGNVYVTGYETSLNMPVQNPGGGAYYQGSFAGQYDAFILKFTNAGALVWATYFGGSQPDGGYSLCTDPSGNLYVTCNTKSSNMPAVNPGGGAYFLSTLPTSGNFHTFIAKFNTAGALVWGTYFGAISESEFVHSVTSDANGNIFLTGFVWGASPALLPTANPGGGAYFQSASGGDVDVFITKFDNANALVWSTYFGGNGRDVGYSICTDASNNVILTGSTNSFNFPVLNAFQSTNVSSLACSWCSKKDAFVAKFTNSGVLLNSSYLGGADDETGSGVATDASGNIFIAGQTGSNNFPTVNPGGAYMQASYSGFKTNIFITKLNTAFQPVWSTYYAGIGNDVCMLDTTIFSDQGGGNNLAVDGCGNVYLGFFAYADPAIPVQQPCSGGYFNANSSGCNSCYDDFLVKFNNTGVRLWATYFGLPNYTSLDMSLAVDNNNNLFAVSEWNGAGHVVVNPGGGAYVDTTYNGSGLGDDTGIGKFLPDNSTFSTSATPAGCNCTGTASVTATSGCLQAIAWFNSSWVYLGNTATISNLCPGNYNIVVTDCKMDTAIVTVAGTNTVSATPQTQTICTGQSATLTASSATSYSWSTGQTSSSIVVTPTANSTYTLIAQNGICTDTIVDTVKVSNSILSASATSAIICSGQNTTLTASGGNNYSWNTSATTSAITVSPTTNSSYTVIVSNSSGCSATVVSTVTVNPSPTANAGNNATICPGDNVTLSGTGNGNYIWNPGGQTASAIVVSPTANSTYTFSVTNSCGTKDTTVSITISNSIAASIIGNINLCSGQSTTLTASGGSSFSWSTGQSSAVIIVSPTSNATYSVTVHSGSCADSTSIAINVTQTPTASVSPNGTICSGQTATLTASGGNNYLWTNGNTTSSVSVSPTTNTTYSVIVSNGSCADTTSATVIVNQLPAPTITGNISLCKGDVTTLTANGATNYSWSNGQTTTSVILSPSVTTSYTLTASNSNCSSAAIVTVNVSPPPTASVSNATICSGQGTILSASGGGNYSWSNGATTSSIIVSPTSTSNYSVVVSIGSCADSANAMVTVNPNPIATAYSDTTIEQGQSVTLSASGGGTYSWSNGSIGSSVVVSPPVTTQYCVYVSTNNCSDTACVIVTVEPTDCSFSATGELYFPNAFSPNDDGDDETFGLYFIRYDCIKTFLLRIYNRWGEKIFETEDPKEKWEGTYKGKKEESAVFAYYLKYELKDGRKAERKGNVSLIK